VVLLNCFSTGSLYEEGLIIFSNIYFLDIDSLVTRLKDGTFGETDALRHLIVVGILGGLGIEIPVTVTFTDTEPSGLVSFVNLLFFVLSGYVTYYGYWVVYQSNSKGDGKDFFLRVTALTLPIMFRLLVYGVFLGLILAGTSIIISDSLSSVSVTVMSAIISVAGASFVACYFLMMRNSISNVAAYNKFRQEDA